MTLPRRTALTAVLGLLLSSCAPKQVGDVFTPDENPEVSPAAPALPSVSAFEVADGEPAPEVKLAAARFLEALLNYEAAEGNPEAAGQRLSTAGLSTGTEGLDVSLLEEDAAAAVQVIYPQLGGLTETEAAIMAVVEFTRLRGSALLTQMRTIDLRLESGGEEWEVTELASGGGEEPETEEEPTEAAREVLASENILLPHSAQWDIRAGGIEDRLLEMMLLLSAEHTISVAVLSTGHPRHVFDSDSVSNHIRGRAVDIWAIDGVSVSDLRVQGGANPARDLMELALSEGATEVGGPWVVSSPEGSSFTDTVHEDHLHIGFKEEA